MLGDGTYNTAAYGTRPYSGGRTDLHAESNQNDNYSGATRGFLVPVVRVRPGWLKCFWVILVAKAKG